MSTFSLGILPAKSDFLWVLLEGSGDEGLQVYDSKRALIPDFGCRDQELAWLYTNVSETFAGLTLGAACVVQGALGRTNTEAVLLRAQVEGVILASLGARKISVTSIKKASMLTEFGLKRGADIVDIPDLLALRSSSKLPKYFDEAISAALVARRQGQLAQAA